MSMEIREVAPGDLIVAANVRRDVALSKEFVASVKQHGVKVPIIVQEGLTGLDVIDGQRRTLAAVEAGLSVVPVVVQAAVADDGQRIVEQLVVNEHRSGLSNADQVEAIRDLALFGMSATAIAKKVGEKKATVDVALKVAETPAAVGLMREHQVSLESAALLAEVSAVDDEYAAELADRLANGYTIGYSVEQWRATQAEKAVAEQIVATGLTLVEEPGWQSDDPRDLGSLYVDEALTQPLSELPEKEWRKLAGAGLVAFTERGWDGNERKVMIGYGVQGWRELGLFGRDRSYGSSPKPSTPEEAEALKAERRAARERTKAWAIATEYRLPFLQEVLKRKALPAGWEQMVAAHALKQGGPTQNTTEAMALLQFERADGDGYGAQPLRTALANQPQKAARVALALALADWEGRRDFDRKGWQSDGVADYLRVLTGWGYELTDVEREVIDGSAAA